MVILLVFDKMIEKRSGKTEGIMLVPRSAAEAASMDRFYERMSREAEAAEMEGLPDKFCGFVSEEDFEWEWRRMRDKAKKSAAKRAAKRKEQEWEKQNIEYSAKMKREKEEKKERQENLKSEWEKMSFAKKEEMKIVAMIEAKKEDAERAQAEAERVQRAAERAEAEAKEAAERAERRAKEAEEKFLEDTVVERAFVEMCLEKSDGRIKGKTIARAFQVFCNINNKTMYSGWGYRIYKILGVTDRSQIFFRIKTPACNRLRQSFQSRGLID